jgi:hypothetical protein
MPEVVISAYVGRGPLQADTATTLNTAAIPNSSISRMVSPRGFKPARVASLGGCGPVHDPWWQRREARFTRSAPFLCAAGNGRTVAPDFALPEPA